MSEYFGDIVDELKAISPQEPVIIINATTIRHWRHRCHMQKVLFFGKTS